MGKPPPPATATSAPEEVAEAEEEEDYMSMALPEAASSAPETSLQRRQRERREAAARGRVKSKAELAAEATARREAGLARSLLDTSTSTTNSFPSSSSSSAAAAAAGGGKLRKGLAMMAKMGFDAASPHAEPLPLVVRPDRAGIGKRPAQDAADDGAGKRARTITTATATAAPVDENEYRARAGRERDAGRREAQLEAAQRIAEQMATGAEGAGTPPPPPPPLRTISVLWRGQVRRRAEADRDRRMRHDLQQSLSRLPTYEDDDEDDDDRRALGRGRAGATTAAVMVVVEDAELDEEDAELDEFNGLQVGERLQRVVDHLRSAHRYCFWCKYTYPDEEMEGCPGRTEEDHD